MQFPYNSREGYSETTRVSNIAEGRLTTHECRIQFLLSACRGVPSKSQGGCSPRDELISCSDCSDISRTYWFISEHFRHHRHQGVPTLLRQGQTLMRSRRYWPQNQWVGGPTGNSQVGLERQWLKVLDTGSTGSFSQFVFMFVSGFYIFYNPSTRKDWSSFLAKAMWSCWVWLQMNLCLWEKPSASARAWELHNHAVLLDIARFLSIGWMVQNVFQLSYTKRDKIIQHHTTTSRV